MRFTYAESMCDPHQLGPLAQAAEEAGYNSVTIPDSICFPKESDTEYPYNQDGNREFLTASPSSSPFVLMAALAALTTRVRFTTFVIKLPIRQPGAGGEAGQLGRLPVAQPASCSASGSRPGPRTT